jgi:putative ABC transport system substrate-binding protein
VRRRDFLTLVGGAAAWPVAARAQQLNSTIGFLTLGSPEGEASFVAAFRNGLSEGGYVEGRNVAIEFRWAQNDVSRLPELAADLVRRRVAAIVVPTATPAVLAAKAATATIPIIFRVGFDPVQSGLVTSLNRPRGNITGVSALSQQVVTKRLGLLDEMKPGNGPIAAMVNPVDDPGAERTVAELRAASKTIGRPIEVFFAHTKGTRLSIA